MINVSYYQLKNSFEDFPIHLLLKLEEKCEKVKELLELELKAKFDVFTMYQK